MWQEGPHGPVVTSQSELWMPPLTQWGGWLIADAALVGRFGSQQCESQLQMDPHVSDRDHNQTAPLRTVAGMEVVREAQKRLQESRLPPLPSTKCDEPAWFWSGPRWVQWCTQTHLLLVLT